MSQLLPVELILRVLASLPKTELDNDRYRQIQCALTNEHLEGPYFWNLVLSINCPILAQLMGERAYLMGPACALRTVSRDDFLVCRLHESMIARLRESQEISISMSVLLKAGLSILVYLQAMRLVDGISAKTTYYVQCCLKTRLSPGAILALRCFIMSLFFLLDDERKSRKEKDYATLIQEQEFPFMTEQEIPYQLEGDKTFGCNDLHQLFPKGVDKNTLDLAVKQWNHREDLGYDYLAFEAALLFCPFPCWKLLLSQAGLVEGLTGFHSYDRTPVPLPQKSDVYVQSFRQLKWEVKSELPKVHLVPPPKESVSSNPHLAVYIMETRCHKMGGGELRDVTAVLEAVGLVANPERLRAVWEWFKTDDNAGQIIDSVRLGDEGKAIRRAARSPFTTNRDWDFGNIRLDRILSHEPRAR